MDNIDSVMNDISDAVDIALKGHVCEHQIHDDRVADVVAKVRALVTPVFERVTSLYSAIDDYGDEIGELEDEVAEYQTAEANRQNDQERKILIDLFNCY